MSNFHFSTCNTYSMAAHGISTQSTSWKHSCSCILHPPGTSTQHQCHRALSHTLSLSAFVPSSMSSKTLSSQDNSLKRNDNRITEKRTAAGESAVRNSKDRAVFKSLTKATTCCTLSQTSFTRCSTQYTETVPAQVLCIPRDRKLSLISTYTAPWRTGKRRVHCMVDHTR